MAAEYQPWPNPIPQSDHGLHALTVYGQHVQSVNGISHEITCGSNIQITADPGTLVLLEANLPPEEVYDSISYGGLGGKVELVLGTHTTINWGRRYEINMGGETVHFEADQETPSMKYVCQTIALLSFMQSTAYGDIADEDSRAAFLIEAQTTLDSLLMAFMAFQAILKGAHQTMADQLSSAHGDNVSQHSTMWEHGGAAAAARASKGIGKKLGDAVGAAIEEGHFERNITEMMTDAQGAAARGANPPSAIPPEPGSVASVMSDLQNP